MTNRVVEVDSEELPAVRKPCPMDGYAIDTAQAEHECTCTVRGAAGLVARLREHARMIREDDYYASSVADDLDAAVAQIERVNDDALRRAEAFPVKGGQLLPVRRKSWFKTVEQKHQPAKAEWIRSGEPKESPHVSAIVCKHNVAGGCDLCGNNL